MTNKKKGNKLLATSLLIMLLLILTTGARLFLNNTFSKQQYEISKTFEGCLADCGDVEPYDYEADLTSERILQQEENRVAIAERKVEEARLVKVEADRKQRLDAERLKRIEEKKKKPKLVSRGNESVGQWIQFEATYYSAFCNTGCTGFTALGWDMRNTIYHDGHRVIAVDPKVIPLGSIVQVKTPNETFYALAGDTGGNIKQYRIDILVDSTATAYKLGRHLVQVRIVKFN